MARSFDIAELMTSDGEYLTDGVRRKINTNFRRLCQMVQSELPSQQTGQVTQVVTTIVDNVLGTALPEMRDELLDDMLPVGSVIVTYTSSDPRLAHGTWQQVGQGRYVRAAGADVAVGETGGSSEVTILPENLPTSEATLQASEDGETVDVVDESETQVPVTIEPEYLALLFYRRVS